MLFLTRRARTGENTILIGDDIRLVVRRLDGDQVRLGIVAPPEIAILREEIKNRDKKNKD